MWNQNKVKRELMKMLIVLNKYLELLSRLVYSLLMNVDVISFD